MMLYGPKYYLLQELINDGSVILHSLKKEMAWVENTEDQVLYINVEFRVSNTEKAKLLDKVIDGIFENEQAEK